MVSDFNRKPQHAHASEVQLLAGMNRNSPTVQPMHRQSQGIRCWLETQSARQSGEDGRGGGTKKTESVLPRGVMQRYNSTHDGASRTHHLGLCTCRTINSQKEFTNDNAGQAAGDRNPPRGVKNRNVWLRDGVAGGALQNVPFHMKHVDRHREKTTTEEQHRQSRSCVHLGVIEKLLPWAAAEISHP